MMQEAQGLKSRMNINNSSLFPTFRVYEGTLSTNKVILIVTGMGEANAAKAAKYVLDKYPIDDILSTGLCGGLNEKSKMGDFIIYNAIKNEEKELVTLCPDCHLILRARAKLAELCLSCTLGTGLTVEKVCSSPTNKRELGVRFCADAVDMESYQLAEASIRNKIPFLTLRCVFDTVYEDLTDVNAVMGNNDSERLKGLYYLLIHPSCVKKLMDYKKRTRILGENLAEFVCGYVNEI